MTLRCKCFRGCGSGGFGSVFGSSKNRWLRKWIARVDRIEERSVIMGSERKKVTCI